MELGKNILTNHKIYFYAIVLSLIFAVVIFFSLLDSFKYYRSKTVVLFIPKNEKTASEANIILKNLETIPKYLRFYERMIEENPELSDPYGNMTRDEKKSAWNRDLKIKRVKDSSILEIEVGAKDKSQAAVLSRKTALTLFGRTVFYYNVKDEIDLRIVEETPALAHIRNLPWLIFISAVLGIISGFLINYIFIEISRLIKNSSAYSPVKKSFGISMEEKKKIFEEKFGYPEQIPNRDIEETYFIPQMKKPEVFHPEKKSEAPANLPIMEESAAPAIQEHQEIEKKVPTEDVFIEYAFQEPVRGEEKIAPAETKEPTEEEFKKRLNQLLRGEL